jgi:hypothetical protein
MSSLRRLPAVLWLPVYVGSVFVVMGSHKRNLLIARLSSLLLACCGARASRTTNPSPASASTTRRWAITPRFTTT